ncbi:MAG: hypothetical protein ACOY5C_02855 [Pseudomonadota bacterium]
MAFNNDYIFRGLLVPQAYHRLASVTAFKDSDGVIKLHLTLEIRLAPDQPPLDVRSHIGPYALDGAANAYAQGYRYLMNLPEFAGATSC